MLKKALLTTILATATFTLAGAQPPADTDDVRDSADRAQGVAPSDEKADPGAAAEPSPRLEGRGSAKEEAAPSQKGIAEQDTKPERKSKDAKRETTDNRAKGTKRQDGQGAVEGETESPPPPGDRAAEKLKREERRRAKAESPERAKGQTVPEEDAQILQPAGEAKTGKSEKAAEGKRENASPDAKAEKRQQPAVPPAQAEGSVEPQDSKAAKPAQDKDSATNDVGQKSSESTKAPRMLEGDEADRGQNQQEPKPPHERSGPDRPAPREAAAPAPEVKKQAVMPADEQQAKDVIRKERAAADEEFEKAKESAKAAYGSGNEAPRVDERAASRFEKVRKERRERVEQGGVALIEEPDKRVIVRKKDRAFIQHDEGERLRRSTKELRRERRSDGTTIVVNLGIGGVEITSIFNDDGQLLRRSRHDRGREFVLIDNSDFYRRHRGRRYVDAYVDLPPLALNIPREKYVVEYEGASEDEVYDALIAPPLERLDRGYSLEEVRQSYRLRERMRRVDLDAINFAFASWEVDDDQYPKLERVADAIKRIIERTPDEVFMIEGHTDAVGSDIDNLSLSDRRAETVAIILSDTFRVPPENLVTQGYGEQFLKVETEAPSRENRRVAVRRVTPLLSRNQRQSLDQ